MRRGVARRGRGFNYMNPGTTPVKPDDQLDSSRESDVVLLDTPPATMAEVDSAPESLDEPAGVEWGTRALPTDPDVIVLSSEHSGTSSADTSFSAESTVTEDAEKIEVTEYFLTEERVLRASVLTRTGRLLDHETLSYRVRVHRVGRSSNPPYPMLEEPTAMEDSVLVSEAVPTPPEDYVLEILADDELDHLFVELAASVDAIDAAPSCSTVTTPVEAATLRSSVPVEADTLRSSVPVEADTLRSTVPAETATQRSTVTMPVEAVTPRSAVPILTEAGPSCAGTFGRAPPTRTTYHSRSSAGSGTMGARTSGPGKPMPAEAASNSPVGFDNMGARTSGPGQPGPTRAAQDVNPVGSGNMGARTSGPGQPGPTRAAPPSGPTNAVRGRRNRRRGKSNATADPSSGTPSNNYRPAGYNGNSSQQARTPRANDSSPYGRHGQAPLPPLSPGPMRPVEQSTLHDPTKQAQTRKAVPFSSFDRNTWPPRLQALAVEMSQQARRDPRPHRYSRLHIEDRMRYRVTVTKDAEIHVTKLGRTRPVPPNQG